MKKLIIVLAISLLSACGGNSGVEGAYIEPMIGSFTFKSNGKVDMVGMGTYDENKNKVVKEASYKAEGNKISIFIDGKELILMRANDGSLNLGNAKFLKQ